MSTKASKPASPASNLAALATAAVEQAAQVQPRQRVGTVVAGPFEVGGLGEVSVIEREQGNTGKSFTFAEFVTPGGKPKSIPLAAVARLSEELRSE
jgi:hypothetical protein